MRRSTSVAASIIAKIKVLTLTARKEAPLIMLIEIRAFFCPHSINDDGLGESATKC